MTSAVRCLSEELFLPVPLHGLVGRGGSTAALGQPLMYFSSFGLTGYWKEPHQCSFYALFVLNLSQREGSGSNWVLDSPSLLSTFADTIASYSFITKWENQSSLANLVSGKSWEAEQEDPR
jgi:hypothetical protein